MKKGWTYKTLGDIATSMYRGSGIRRDQVTFEGIPCIRYGEIYTTYNISFSECVSHTQESFIPNPKYFEHGDLLFAITGESVEDIGKTIAYMGKEKCMLGGDIICMKHNENPKYLSYALSTPDAIRQKGFGKTKLKVVHTNAPSLKSIKIPIPSLDEQQRIVERLDAAFAQIDELKSNAERQLAEARALFQSALTEAMQPKPGWQEKALNSISHYSIGLTYKPADVNENGTIVLRSSNIQNDRIDLTDLVRVSCPIKESLFVEEGDILMCSRNGSARLVGKVAMIPKTTERMTYGTFMMVIKSEYNPYLLYFFKSDSFRNQIKHGEANMINQITRYMLDDVIVNVPPIIEQKDVVEHLDSLSLHVRELEEISRKTAAECDALKQALLRQIFE